jgi:hypothetical protein
MTVPCERRRLLPGRRLAVAASGQVSGVYAAAAAAYRDAEAFHLSVAEMAESMAVRLEGWLAHPDPHVARPRLVNVAAGMLGMPSAAGGLRGAGASVGDRCHGAGRVGS